MFANGLMMNRQNPHFFEADRVQRSPRELHLENIIAPSTMSSSRTNSTPSPASFLRTSSAQSFASRASTKSGSTSSGHHQLQHHSLHHSRTGSFADFVVKFSEMTQDLTQCSSMERIPKVPKEKPDYLKKPFMTRTPRAKNQKPAWAVECECIEVEENDVLQTAYELHRV